MRRLALVLLASALALAAIEAAQADSLQVTPKKNQKYQQPSPYNDTYPTLHGRSYSSNSLPDPGSDNRYYSDSLRPTSIQGPAFTSNLGGWTVLPCTRDVFGCF
jgi:hypothetical protein